MEDEDAIAILSLFGPERFSAEWNALRRIELAARALVMQPDRREIHEADLARALAVYDAVGNRGPD